MLMYGIYNLYNTIQLPGISSKEICNTLFRLQFREYSVYESSYKNSEWIQMIITVSCKIVMIILIHILLIMDSNNLIISLTISECSMVESCNKII